jgi:hypothetical protein
MHPQARKFVEQPRPRTARTTHWGEKKSCRSVNLTDTCWALLTALADKEGCNRSEWLERYVRQASVDEVDGLNAVV